MNTLTCPENWAAPPDQVATARKLGKVCSTAVRVRNARQSGTGLQEIAALGQDERSMIALLRTPLAADRLLHHLLSDGGNLIGSGAQSLVFDRGNTVEKIDYHNLGLSREAQAQHIKNRQQSYQAIAGALGDIALPTMFVGAHLAYRVPSVGQHHTTAAIQPRLGGGVDAFSGTGRGILATGGTELTAQADTLARTTEEMLASGVLVDIIGRGNVMLQNGNLRLVDVDPIHPMYFEETVPGTSRTHTEQASFLIDELRSYSQSQVMALV